MSQHEQQADRLDDEATSCRSAPSAWARRSPTCARTGSASRPTTPCPARSASRRRRRAAAAGARRDRLERESPGGAASPGCLRGMVSASPGTAMTTRSAANAPAEARQLAERPIAGQSLSTASARSPSAPSACGEPASGASRMSGSASSSTPEASIAASAMSSRASASRAGAHSTRLASSAGGRPT